MISDLVGHLLWSGWLSLLDYLAAHVLLCLVPAFIIAGYMSAMIPGEAVTRFLGPAARKWISYPAAALGGFVLAVCSCTILPLFAGIWKRGAGLGPAITFLFVGPAVNILAIAYTGSAIGPDIALARIVLSLVFGVVIGLVMAWAFQGEERQRAAALAGDSPFDRQARVRPVVWIVFLLLVSILLVGTLKIELLTDVWFNLHIPLEMPPTLLNLLTSANLTPQGAFLIAMLLLAVPLAHLGLDRVLEKFSGWTYGVLGLVGLTLLAAAPTVGQGSLLIGVTGRLVGVAILMAAIGLTTSLAFQKEDIASWLWETWKFVKQIFPLLIAGVFLAGVIKAIIPGQWVQAVAGRNTLLANLVGVLFGVFMYFPTLVEVPVARMFLDLGMHRGPLLAYLLADPELSVQSILVTGRIMGRKKTAVYVALVAVFSTLAGYLFGMVASAL